MHGGRLRQEKQDEAKVSREESQRGGRSGRMRTVDMDDELIHRGANPRTGAVTPFMVSDSSAESGGEYFAVRDTRNAKSGRSKQDHAGWIFESLLSKQDVGERPNGGVSTRELQDKFVMEMPGVDNPEPAEMTLADIKRVQEWFQNANTSQKKSAASGETDCFFPGQNLWAQEGPGM